MTHDPLISRREVQDLEAGTRLGQVDTTLAAGRLRPPRRQRALAGPPSIFSNPVGLTAS